jgi:peptidoglycan/LPS O-acetylase OafA/YrhL
MDGAADVRNESVRAGWVTGWGDPVRPVAVRRFYLLDGARALAALAVLFFHYHHFFVPPGVKPEPALHGGSEPLRALFAPLYEHGHLSVSFFWVLSGFVFAATYNREAASSRDFFVNRLARLYPLHLLTLCIIAGLQALASARYGHWLLVAITTSPTSSRNCSSHPTGGWFREARSTGRSGRCRSRS